MRAVAQDIGVDAVKIGMLGTAATIEAVAQALDGCRPGTPVVLDPVMVAESGAELLDPSARGALVELLLPRATVVTPNLPEARALLAEPTTATSPSSRRRDPRSGPGRSSWSPAAIATHATDVFYDGAQLVEIPGERHPDGAAHGSGCTHSSVLAARLAWGDQPLRRRARPSAERPTAVRDGLTSRSGAGRGRSTSWA